MLNKVDIVVATDLNGMIAKDGQIPWKCKSDMKFFKDLTIGHTVIMGRKTFESLPSPLNNRMHFVLSRSLKDKNSIYVRYFSDIDEIFKSLLDQSYEQYGSKYFVIGGGEIYKEFLVNYKKYIENIYINKIKVEVVPNQSSIYFPIDYLDNLEAVSVSENEDYISYKYM